MSYKQIIVIRKDLKMGFGKMISQACHASLLSYEATNKSIREKWESEGSKKVVLGVNSLKELRETSKKLKESRISCVVIRDAGLTQLESGTITALGIGPVEERKIDKVTGKLKLL